MVFSKAISFCLQVVVVVDVIVVVVYYYYHIRENSTVKQAE